MEDKLSMVRAIATEDAPLLSALKEAERRERLQDMIRESERQGLYDVPEFDIEEGRVDKLD